MRRLALFAIATLVASGVPAAALEAVTLVTPAGEQRVDEAALRALPPLSEEVVFMTRGGAERGDYNGPLLWRVVDGARFGDEGKLLRTIVVTGRDGYAVVFSLAEIDPEYGNEPALLAYARNGAEIAASEGPRLVVPGDKRGSRAVKDVVRIEVR